MNTMNQEFGGKGMSAALKSVRLLQPSAFSLNHDAGRASLQHNRGGTGNYG